MFTLTDPSLLRDTLYIAGNWRKPAICSSLDVFNPATGALVRSALQAGRENAAATDAAEDACPEWSARTAKDRFVLLCRRHDLVIDNVDNLAHILTTEQGKPFLEAIADILFGAAFFEWFAEEVNICVSEISIGKPN
jgi:succinate-semialdehyde dehydrogenase/glutarate-semialdehyde dehydrogenase